MLCNYTLKAYIILDMYRGGILNIFKRFIPRLIIVLVMCIISAIGIFTEKNLTANKEISQNRKIVIIDAGHGGFDGGAVADDGTVEKDINLKISHKLSTMLQFSGIDVIMTRTEDIGTDNTDSKIIANRKKSDLQNRLALMEKYPQALYISVHLNKFTTSAASGTQVFYTKNFPEASKLGQSVQDSVVKMLQPENKRVIKQGTSGTFLLHNAKIPAIIIECGFISNYNELIKLKKEEYQSQIAFAIMGGVLDYINEI